MKWEISGRNVLLELCSRSRRQAAGGASRRIIANADTEDGLKHACKHTDKQAHIHLIFIPLDTRD